MSHRRYRPIDCLFIAFVIALFLFLAWGAFGQPNAIGAN